MHIGVALTHYFIVVAFVFALVFYLSFYRIFCFANVRKASKR